MKRFLSQLLGATALFVLTIAFIGSMAGHASAAAGVRANVTYQARLMDASGYPVADGIYQVQFSLYDNSVAGTRLWTAAGTTVVPTPVNVSVQDGLFTVLLGDGVTQLPFGDLDWNSDSLYLGVTIGGDAEMSPRRPITAVPQAINSSQLSGMSASGTDTYGGESQFTINQASTTAATSTRSALDVRTNGTSLANDFILRGLDGTGSAVFTLNSQGSVTSSNLFVSGVVSTTQLFVNGQQVCLQDGSNCLYPAEADTFASVTARGATTSQALTLFAGATMNILNVTDTATIANLNTTNLVATDTTTTNLFSTVVSTTALFVNGQTVCLNDGTNCPASFEIDTLASVTARGATTSVAVTFFGGVTTTDLNVTTELLSPSGTITALFWSDATGTNTTGTNAYFTNLRGSSASFADLLSTSSTFGQATATAFFSTVLTATDAGIVNATATNLVFTNASGASMVVTVLNGSTVNASTSNIGSLTFANATGGILDIVSVSATSLIVSGQNVCLANGTNCLTVYSTDTLAAITARGATTSVPVSFFGGVTTTNLNASSALIDSLITINSTSTNATATNAFITSLVTGSASSSNFFSSSVWGTSASFTNLMVSGTLVCLADGTNCSYPTEADTLLSVTNRGSVATATLSLLGGALTNNLNVSNTATIANAIVTSTLTVSGTVSSDLVPTTDLTFSLGTPSLRWNGNFGDVTIVNSTTSNSTSTNFFATTASSTNLFSSNATLGSLIANSGNIAELLATNATLTNVTSTNGVFTNLLGANVVAGTATIGSSIVGTSTVGFVNVTGSLFAPTSTITNLNSSNLFATLVSSTQVLVNGLDVCLEDGTNCVPLAGEADTLASVTARGATTSVAVTFFGGVTTTNLNATSALIDGLSWTSATGTNTTGTNAFFANLRGTTGSFSELYSASSTLGQATATAFFAQTFTATDAGITNATTTNLAFTNASGASMIVTVLNSATVNASTSNIGTATIGTANVTTGTVTSLVFTNATGATLDIGSVSATSLLVSGQNVCLADGTNCLSMYSTDTLATVTARGATTSFAVTFFGGATASNLNVSGTSNLANINASTVAVSGGISAATGSITGLVATNATATNVTSTNLFATNGTVTNGVISNVTSTNAFITSLVTSAVSSTSFFSSSVWGTSASFTNLMVSGTLVCLADGTNCTYPAAADTLLSVTNRGSVATATLTLLGGALTNNLNVSNTATIANAIVTSTLVVSGTVSSDLIPTTDLTYSLGSASLRWNGNFGNVTIVNGTTTNATSTNFFTTTASSTNLFAANATLGSLIANSGNIAELLATNATLTNVTSTNGIFTNLLGTSLVAGTATIGSSTVGTSTVGFINVTGSLFAPTGTVTNLNSTNFFSTFVSSTQVLVNGIDVCLADGTNCVPLAGEADTLASVTARGATTSVAVTFFGGVTTTNLNASSALIDGLVSTNATATNVTTTNLVATNGSITGLSWTNATGTNTTGTNAFFANLRGTTASFSELYSVSSTLGQATATAFFTQTFTATDAGITNVTTTNLAFTNASGASMIVTVLNSSTVNASTSNIGTATIGTANVTTGTITSLTFTNATGATLEIGAVSATSLLVSGQNVCLSNGTNCLPIAASSDTLYAVTTRGATTSIAVTFFGGVTSSNLNVSGTSNLANVNASTVNISGGISAATGSIAGLTATNATASNVTTTNSFATTASSTNLFSTNGSISVLTSNSGSIASLSGTSLIYTNATFTNVSSTVYSLGSGAIGSSAIGTSTIGFVNVTGSLFSPTGTITSLNVSNLFGNAATFTNGTSSGFASGIGFFGTSTMGFVNVTGSILVGGVSVCLQNGVNCPAATEADTLATVTARGGTATSSVTFFGGVTTSLINVTGTANAQYLNASSVAILNGLSASTATFSNATTGGLSAGIGFIGTSTQGFLNVTNTLRATSGTITALNSTNLFSVNGAITNATTSGLYAGIGFFGTSTMGVINVTSTAQLNGNVFLGDSSADSIVANGRFITNLVPDVDGARTLGFTTNRWNAFLGDVNASNTTSSGLAAGIGTFGTSTMGFVTVTGTLSALTGNFSSLSASVYALGAGSISSSNVGFLNVTNSLVATTGTITNLNSTNLFSVNGNFTNVTTTGLSAAIGFITSSTQGTLNVTGQTQFNNNVIIGDATTDLIVTTGRFISNMIPNVDNNNTLGLLSNRWDANLADVNASNTTSSALSAGMGFFGTSTLGILNVTSTAQFNDGVILGDLSSDIIAMNGRVATNIVPDSIGRFLGLPALRWNAYLGDVSASNTTSSGMAAGLGFFGSSTMGNVNVTGTFTVLNGNFSNLTAGNGFFGTSTMGFVNVTSLAQLNGNVFLGDSSADGIAINGSIITNIFPNVDGRILGLPATRWHAYLGDVSASNTTSVAMSAGIGFFGTSTMGVLNVTSTAQFSGNVTLGDSGSDIITVGGRFGSSLIPSSPSGLILGNTSNRWDAFFNNVSSSVLTNGIGFFGTSTMGVVNVTSSIQVGGVNVCLANGTNCPAGSGSLQTAYNNGSVVTTTNGAVSFISASTSGNINPTGTDPIYAIQNWKTASSVYGAGGIVAAAVVSADTSSSYQSFFAFTSDVNQPLAGFYANQAATSTLMFHDQANGQFAFYSIGGNNVLTMLIDPANNNIGFNAGNIGLGDSATQVNIPGTATVNNLDATNVTTTNLHVDQGYLTIDVLDGDIGGPGDAYNTFMSANMPGDPSTRGFSALYVTSGTTNGTMLYHSDNNTGTDFADIQFGNIFSGGTDHGVSIEVRDNAGASYNNTFFLATSTIFSNHVLPRTDLAHYLGSSSLRWNATLGNVSSTNVTTSGLYAGIGFFGTSTMGILNVTSTLQVAGVNVCLQNGTNCPASGSSDWTYSAALDLLRPATSSANILIGAANTSTAGAPAYFDTNSAGSSTFFFGFATSANVAVGTTTITNTGLNTAFTMNGNDFLVAGNIGSVSSVYTNGEFVVGPGSTHYGDGYINKNNGSLTLMASTGFVLPATDLGLSFGSAALRFNGYFGSVTSTNATTSFLTAGTSTMGNLTVTSTLVASSVRMYGGLNLVLSSSTEIATVASLLANPSVINSTGVHLTALGNKFYAELTTGTSQFITSDAISGKTVNVGTSNVKHFSPGTGNGSNDGVALRDDGTLTMGGSTVYTTTTFDLTTSSVLLANGKMLIVGDRTRLYAFGINHGANGANGIEYINQVTLTGTPAGILSIDQDSSDDSQYIISYFEAGTKLQRVSCTLFTGCSLTGAASNVISASPVEVQEMGGYYYAPIPQLNQVVRFLNSGSWSTSTAYVMGDATARKISTDNGYVAVLGQNLSIIDVKNGTRKTLEGVGGTVYGDVEMIGNYVAIVGENGWLTYSIGGVRALGGEFGSLLAGNGAFEDSLMVNGSLRVGSGLNVLGGGIDVLGGLSVSRGEVYFDGHVFMGPSNATDTTNYRQVISYAGSSAVAGLCLDDTNTITSCTTTTLTNISIQADAAVNANAFDLAEMYNVSGPSEAGDVLLFDPTATATVQISGGTRYDRRIAGVVSTRPGFLLGWASGTQTQVALAGRVPTKVSVTNGEIKVGDALTTSEYSGYAMKATKPGMILGYALEDISATGTIEVFIDTGYNAATALGTDGSVAMITDNLVIKGLESASVSTSTVDSFSLTFHGEGWDTTSTMALAYDFTLRTDMLSTTNARFVIENSFGSSTFSVDQDGIVRANAFEVNDSFDLAERYESADTLEPGDLVMISADADRQILRATDEQSVAIGVISTKAGFTLGANASGTYPVALAGRVPTKVTSLNGEIKRGDALVASTIPGVAQKATVAGQIIGYALENYAGTDNGLIEAFIQPGLWIPKEKLETLAGTSTSTGSGSGTGAARQGFAKIVTGGSRVHIVYNSINAFPVPQVTAMGNVSGGWWLENVTDIGFDIVMDTIQPIDIQFAWQVSPSQIGIMQYSSDGTYGQLDPLTGQLVEEPPAE